MTGGLRCLKAGPAAVSDMVSAQLTESDFQTHPRKPIQPVHWLTLPCIRPESTHHM